MKDRRISVCFFGIIRALDHTIASIEDQILTPAREMGEVKIYSHLFRQEFVSNPRSGESGHVDLKGHRVLNSDWLEIEEPDQCLPLYDFEKLKAHGDRWGDSSRSLRNLVHQLHSLKTVTKAALAPGADAYLFVRPDLAYHDSFRDEIKAALARPETHIGTPNWQHWGHGFNDRFAIASGDAAAKAYGMRVRDIEAFLESNPTGLHGESLVKFVLKKRGIRPHFFRLRASRVRVNGEAADEDFTDFRVLRAKNMLRKLGVLRGRRA